ncbi:hypothetical protein K402DRAFT_394628, partial [Aulographum hederae CBS 113979]
MWQYYKQLDLGLHRNQPVFASQQPLRQDFLGSFFTDEAELHSVISDDDDEKIGSSARRGCHEGRGSGWDEMDEFQQSSDRSLCFVEDPIQFWIENKFRWPHVSRIALEIYGIPPSEADNE